MSQWLDKRELRLAQQLRAADLKQSSSNRSEFKFFKSADASMISSNFQQQQSHSQSHFLKMKLAELVRNRESLEEQKKEKLKILNDLKRKSTSSSSFIPPSVIDKENVSAKAQQPTFKRPLDLGSTWKVISLKEQQLEDELSKM
jgi:hypothetical protein